MKIKPLPQISVKSLTQCASIVPLFCSSSTDMAIYGHCPAQDDFFLVVCSHCGKVVKPQAFEEHCLRRHGSLTKVYGQCNTTLQQPSHPPSNVSRDRQRGRSKETSVPAATRRTARPQKEAVRYGFICCQQA